HFEFVIAFHGWDHDFRAQRRLRKRNRHYTIKIIAFALKERVLLHVQYNVQVASRTTECPRLAISRKTNTRSVFDASGNFRLDHAIAHPASFAFALRGWIGDHAARPLASGACACDAEKPLLITNLSMPIACAALHGRLAWRCARPVACVASLMPAHFD